MKKILLVNNCYPSDKYPHFSTYIKTIESCLNRAGFQVELLVIKKRWNSKLMRVIYRAFFVFKCFFTTKLGRCDYVYINHPPFAVSLLLRPLIKQKHIFVHWHGMDLVSPGFSISLIRKYIYSRLDITHILPSNYFKTILLQKTSISEERVVVSPSGGVDVNLFVNIPKEEKNEYIIGYASSLHRNKGANTLFHLLIKFKGVEIDGKAVKFMIIEYGLELEFYKKKFAPYQDMIYYVEKKPKEEMFLFYNSIDILIMPTIYKSESLGLVVLEAMSCAIPVVAYNLFAMPEFVISGFSGELVEYRKDLNIEGFFNKIIIVLSTKAKYTPRAVVLEKYSHEQVITHYKQILNIDLENKIT